MAKLGLKIIASGAPDSSEPAPGTTAFGLRAKERMAVIMGEQAKRRQQRIAIPPEPALNYRKDSLVAKRKGRPSDSSEDEA